nr:ubiquitin carboxyl-terminal hydrolase 37-like [Paramormyrops kingsleyae]
MDGVITMSCGVFSCWPRKKQRNISAAEGADVDKPQKRRLKFQRKFPWLKLVKSRAKESSDEDGGLSGDCRDSGDSNALSSGQSPSLSVVNSESLTSSASSTDTSVEEHQSPPVMTQDIPPNEGPERSLRRIPKWLLPCFMGDRGDAAVGESQRLVCLGLPNLGQTCYMNATLQCLFHLPSFCGDISRQEEYWQLVPSADLLRFFSELLASTHGSSRRQKMALLKNLLPEVACHFDEDEQNDAEVELTCATCGGSQAVLSWSFLTLPRVLVLHFKRFSYTPKYELKKVRDPVLLCREITLLPHFSQVTGTPQSADPEEPHLKDDETTQEAHT